MSVADDSDLDNENPSSKLNPQSNRKKVSALCYGLVKEKMSVLNYVSQVFDHLSQKLKFYENIFISL